MDRLGSDVVAYDDLVAAIEGFGFDETDLDELLDHDELLGETDAGIHHLPGLVDGLRFTVPVDADLAAEDELRLHPWLASLVWWLVVEDVELAGHADGPEPVVLATDGRWIDGRDEDVLIGPDGWLTDLAGGWAEVTVEGRALRFTPATGPNRPEPAQVDAIDRAFDRVVRTTEVSPIVGDGPVDLAWSVVERVFDEALAADRPIFLAAPIAAIPELFEAAGLEIAGRDVARTGFDWEALDHLRRRGRLLVTYELDSEDDADAVMLVVGAVSSVLAEPGPDSTALGETDEEREGATILITGLLERGQVADAVWEELDERGLIDELDPFVAQLEWAMEDVDVVAPRWLRARLLDRAGRSAEAAELLAEAVGPTCRHRPALLDLAGHVADRSDLGRANELIRRSGVLEGEPHLSPHHETLVDEIAAYRRLPSGSSGRNAPCPCGSGRKTKACHRDGWLDLEHRAGWLTDKLHRYVVHHGDARCRELVEAMTGDDGGPLAELRFWEWPLTYDLALWEGKLIDGFVASRAALLPADEAALLTPWAEAHRTVLEMRSARGRQVTFDDLLFGGQRVVENIHPDSRMRPGLRMLARPVPVEGRLRMLTPLMPLGDDDTDSTVDALGTGDLRTLAAALGRVVRGR